MERNVHTKTIVPESAVMREFNAAVEKFDALTGYKWDTVSSGIALAVLANTLGLDKQLACKLMTTSLAVMLEAQTQRTQKNN